MQQKCCNQRKKREATQVATILKIIADENRLKILCVLKKGERCVCDIWRDIGISQNLVSHHLGVLKQAELIDSRKEGLKVIYFINTEKLTQFVSLLHNFLLSYGK